MKFFWYLHWFTYLPQKAKKRWCHPFWMSLRIKFHLFLEFFIVIFIWIIIKNIIISIIYIVTFIFIVINWNYIWIDVWIQIWIQIRHDMWYEMSAIRIEIKIGVWNTNGAIDWYVCAFSFTIIYITW